MAGPSRTSAYQQAGAFRRTKSQETHALQGMDSEQHPDRLKRRHITHACQNDSEFQVGWEGEGAAKGLMQLASGASPYRETTNSSGAAQQASSVVRTTSSCCEREEVKEHNPFVNYAAFSIDDPRGHSQNPLQTLRRNLRLQLRVGRFPESNCRVGSLNHGARPKLRLGEDNIATYTVAAAYASVPRDENGSLLREFPNMLRRRNIGLLAPEDFSDSEETETEPDYWQPGQTGKEE